MGLKDDADQYDEWAEGYDDVVAERDRAGRFPFAGHSVAIKSLVKAVHTAYPQAEVLDLGCGTGDIEERLAELGHSVVGADFSAQMIERAREKAPSAEYLRIDLRTECLKERLQGRRFQVVVSSYFLHNLNHDTRIALLKEINECVLEDDGLVIFADVCFRSEEIRSAVLQSHASDVDPDEDYPVYEDLKKDIPNLVFQQISFCAGLLAFRKFEAPSEETIEETATSIPDPEPVESFDNAADVSEPVTDSAPAQEEPSTSSEISVEPSDDDTDPGYHRYTDEEVKSWKRLHDIPGTSVGEFGVNFARAIAPYEKEAESDWHNVSRRLQNLFGGTFTNRDLSNMRYAVVKSILDSSHTLPADEKETMSIASSYAATLLHNRFPGEKIGLNLFGLYYYLTNDLTVVLNMLKRDYGDNIGALQRDMNNLRGTRAARDLTYGLV